MGIGDGTGESQAQMPYRVWLPSGSGLSGPDPQATALGSAGIWDPFFVLTHGLILLAPSPSHLPCTCPLDLHLLGPAFA